MLARLLHKVVDVRDKELKALLLAFFYHFCLLTSYYIIQPVRDALGLAGGVEDLPGLFALSLVVMLIANPIFATLVKRFPPAKFIPWVYRFFLANLILFYLLLTQVGGKEIGQTFFLWVGIFNLFAISVFWSYVANCFDPQQGKRLYGFIGAGGTAGQLVGSLVTTVLAGRLGAINMLLVAMVLLEGAVWCVKALDAHVALAAGGEALPEKKARSSGSGGGALDGVRAVAQSPYLLGICLYMFLYTFTSSFLYFGRSNAVAAAVGTDASSARFFAASNLTVGIMTLVIQLFLTGRLMAGLGVTLSLSLVPMMTMLGFGFVTVWPLLAVYALFDVSRKTINYAVARPARELLYTVVTREEKYVAKNFIDTFIYRVGDAAASAASTMVNRWILPALPKGEKHAPEVLAAAGRGAAMVAFVFSLFWVITAWWLGRVQQRKAAELAARKPSLN